MPTPPHVFFVYINRIYFLGLVAKWYSVLVRILLDLVTQSQGPVSHLHNRSIKITAAFTYSSTFAPQAYPHLSFFLVLFQILWSFSQSTKVTFAYQYG